MPARTPKRCRARSCGASTTDRSGYCDKHKAEHQKSNWSGYKGVTNSAGLAVYHTPYWRKVIRPYVIDKSNGLCLNHSRANPPQFMPGKVVEHIIPKAKGGDESYKNLSYFCESCARYKTRWERDRAPDEILKKYAHTAIE